MKFYRNNIQDKWFELHLTNGKIIISINESNIKKFLHNNNTSDSKLNLEGNIFTKNMVEEIEFFKPYPYEEISNNFLKGYLNLKKIINLDLTIVKSISSYCFYDMPNLESEISFPNLEYFDKYNFHNMGGLNGYNYPITVLENIKDFDPYMNFLYLETNSYVKLSNNIINILKMKDPSILTMFLTHSLNNISYEKSRGIRIKGLTEEEFEELHVLLPDVYSGYYGRKLIYDGL